MHVSLYSILLFRIKKITPSTDSAVSIIQPRISKEEEIQTLKDTEFLNSNMPKSVKHAKALTIPVFVFNR